VKSRRTWRGVLTLALVGGLSAALIVSPVGAAFNPTRAKIKKIAKKEATKVFNEKIGPATAPFQEEADLLYGTINNAGATGVTLVHGRGITQVIPFVATIVEFERPVNNCTPTATYGGDPNDGMSASVEYDSVNPNRLIVWLFDEFGNFVSGTGVMFHMIVVCP
jgi:hypothetical protein